MVSRMCEVGKKQQLLVNVIMRIGAKSIQSVAALHEMKSRRCLFGRRQGRCVIAPDNVLF